ncbi:MAG: putative structural protein [Nanoarchaeotal virus 1]|nr:MAG: putative structural protein [Nanoarchaeotal virus 1]
MAAQVTKDDILNDLQLVKKGLQEVEFYIRTKDIPAIEKGVNGVIDYMSKILKDIISKQTINYAEILNDAKKKGLEREFRTAYRILRQLNFVDYDKSKSLITIGSRTKYLMKEYTDSKFEKKQEPKEIDTKKVNEIYQWVLDQIEKHGWVEIKVVNKEFEGYQKEVMEAIDKIVTEGKGKLVDGQLYKADNTNTEKLKGTDTSKAKRIKELKDQIDTLERKIEIGQAMELSKEELQKLVEEKKKLEDELKQLENQ